MKPNARAAIFDALGICAEDTGTEAGRKYYDDAQTAFDETLDAIKAIKKVVGAWKRKALRLEKKSLALYKVSGNDDEGWQKSYSLMGEANGLMEAALTLDEILREHKLKR